MHNGSRLMHPFAGVTNLEEEGDFEEVEYQPQQASQGACCHLSGTLGVVHGWVEEETFNAVSEDKERDMASLVSNLVQMGSLRLCKWTVCGALNREFGLSEFGLSL